MSLHCVVLFALYSFSFIISLDAAPIEEEKPQPTYPSIENLKKNLHNFDLTKCFVGSELQIGKETLDPAYLKEVYVARELFKNKKIEDGYEALLTATKAMTIDKPDLVSNHLKIETIFTDPDNVLDKIKKVISLFESDVEKEENSTFILK